MNNFTVPAVVFSMVQGITARINETEQDSDARKSETELKWSSSLARAELFLSKHPRHPAVVTLLELMQLQNQRKAGEIQLSGAATYALFMQAITESVRAVTEPVVTDLAATLGKLQAQMFNAPPHLLYTAKDKAKQARDFLDNPVPREEQTVVTVLVHAIERLVLKVSDHQNPTLADVELFWDADTDTAYAQTKAIVLKYLGREAELEAETEKALPHTAEAYFKQRGETLLKQLNKACVIPKHTQLLNFMAITEGFKNFQALKATLKTGEPNFCPHCGAAGQLEECGTVFCEMGQYDGRSYEAEGDATQHQCSRCNRRFTDWRDWAEAEAEPKTATAEAPEEANPMRVAMLRLESHYGMDGGHSVYDRDYWDQEVEARDTRLTNYWEWLVHQLEANQEMFPWERDNDQNVQLGLAAGLKVVPSNDQGWKVEGKAIEEGLVDPIDREDSEEDAWKTAAADIVAFVFDKHTRAVAVSWETIPLHRKIDIVREVFGQIN